MEDFITYRTIRDIKPEEREEAKRQDAEIAQMLREGQAQHDAWNASMDELLRSHSQRMAEARAGRG